MKDRFDVRLQVTPTLFIGKWTVRILVLLKERPYRHRQLRRGRHLTADAGADAA